jgi:xanthine/uracil permease
VPSVILVLPAENAGHMKAVGTMTEENLDPLLGRSFAGDGVATTLAGLSGGSGTTTYAENIGVMGYTRVYSTLAYLIAGVAAIGIYQILRHIQPEIAAPRPGAFGDPLVSPLAETPDPRSP